MGFLPGRQGSDQIRWTIDIVYHFQSQWNSGTSQEGLYLSINVQKAFDLVSWTYMFKVLVAWGFGHSLDAFYLDPQAKVWAIILIPLGLRGNWSGLPFTH